ncbi:MAG: hypothetical protein U0470_07450 [Anaerolineae bacterium]
MSRGVRPGGALFVDLSWSAEQPITRDLSVFVHLVDPDGLVVAQHDSYPAAGRWATSDWPIGGLVPDRHVFRLPPETAAPCDCTVVVGLYDHRTGRRVPIAPGRAELQLGPVARRADPAPVDPMPVDPARVDPAPPDAVPIARLPSTPSPAPTASRRPCASASATRSSPVGYRLPTRAVRAGETLPLTLLGAARRVSADYKVSVQLARQRRDVGRRGVGGRPAADVGVAAGRGGGRRAAAAGVRRGAAGCVHAVRQGVRSGARRAERRRLRDRAGAGAGAGAGAISRVRGPP